MAPVEPTLDALASGREIALALAVLCTVVNVVATTVLARLSLPARLSRRVDGARDSAEAALQTVARCQQRVEEIEAGQRAFRTEASGLLEEIEAQFERVERKRASAAAAASRAERRAAPSPAPTDRNGIVAALRAARARGEVN